MPCSIRENITQFSTNTRCKTFSLFIYSTGIEKKNGSLQQQQQNKNQKTTQNKKLQTTTSFVVSHMVYWLSRCSLYTVHLSCNLVFESMKKYNFVKN